MMHSKLFRRNIVTLGLLSFFGAPAFAVEAEFKRPLKELKIMSKIFETSLSEQSNKSDRIFGSKKTQATYLANQGMLFSFSFGDNAFVTESDWQNFGQGIGNLVGAIASEVGTALADIPLPDAPEPPDVDFQDLARFEAYQERMELLEEMRERQYSQREEVRSLQREIRELERERHGNSGDRNELNETKKALQRKLATLSSKMEEYNKSMKEYRDTRDRKNQENTQKKTDLIIATLCDYGPTLRSLKNDEHVTLIFKNHTKKTDKAYVFEARAIKDCDSKEELIRGAITYQL